MIGNAKTGAVFVGGYLLGRTGKGKVAIGLGMFLAGRRLPLGPQQFARTPAGSPVPSGLGGQARRELVDATKSAASAALTHRANRLADALHERTPGLGGADGEAPRERNESPGDELAEDAEGPGEEDDGDEAEPLKEAVEAPEEDEER